MRPHTAILIAVYLHLLYKNSSLSSLSGKVTFAGEPKILDVRILSFDQVTKSAEIEVRYMLWSCIGKFENNYGRVTINHSGSVHRRYAQETFKIYSEGSVGEGKTIGSDRYPGYFRSEHIDTGGYQNFTFSGPYVDGAGRTVDTRYNVRLSF